MKGEGRGYTFRMAVISRYTRMQLLLHSNDFIVNVIRLNYRSVDNELAMDV